MAEIEASYHAGRLPWTYKTVQSLITPYPRRGQLDALKPGQEDEATLDAEGVPWEVEAAQNADPENADNDAGDDHEIADFDPADWRQEPEGKLPPCVPHGVEDCPNHGHGENKGRGGKEPTVNLTAEQADALLGHSGRVQSLGQAKEVLKNLGGALAASMTNTLDRVIKDETKRFNQRMQGDAVVDKELRASLEAEEKRCARQRIELQEHMQLVREKKTCRA